MACKPTAISTVYATFTTTVDTSISTDITTKVDGGLPQITLVPTSTSTCDGKDVLGGILGGCLLQTFYGQSTITPSGQVKVLHSFWSGPTEIVTSRAVSTIFASCETSSAARETSESTSEQTTSTTSSTSKTTSTLVLTSTSTSTSDSDAASERHADDSSVSKTQPTATSFSTITRTSAHNAVSGMRGLESAKPTSAPDDSNNSDVGVILGATLGGVAGIFMILVIARFLYRMANSKQGSDADSVFNFTEQPKHHTDDPADDLDAVVLTRPSSDHSLHKERPAQERPAREPPVQGRTVREAPAIRPLPREAPPPMREARRTRFMSPEPSEPSVYSQHSSIFVPRGAPPIPPISAIPLAPKFHVPDAPQPELHVTHQASWSSSYSGGSRLSSISHQPNPSLTAAFNNSSDPLMALAPPVPAPMNPYAPDGEEK